MNKWSKTKRRKQRVPSGKWIPQELIPQSKNHLSILILHASFHLSSFWWFSFLPWWEKEQKEGRTFWFSKWFIQRSQIGKKQNKGKINFLPILPMTLKITHLQHEVKQEMPQKVQTKWLLQYDHTHGICSKTTEEERKYRIIDDKTWVVVPNRLTEYSLCLYLMHVFQIFYYKYVGRSF